MSWLTFWNALEKPRKRPQVINLFIHGLLKCTSGFYGTSIVIPKKITSTNVSCALRAWVTFRITIPFQFRSAFRLANIDLACVAGVIGEGEGERGSRDKMRGIGEIPLIFSRLIVSRVKRFLIVEHSVSFLFGLCIYLIMSDIGVARFSHWSPRKKKRLDRATQRFRTQVF